MSPGKEDKYQQILKLVTNPGQSRNPKAQKATKFVVLFLLSIKNGWSLPCVPLPIVVPVPQHHNSHKQGQIIFNKTFLDISQYIYV